MQRQVAAIDKLCKLSKWLSWLGQIYTETHRTHRTHTCSSGNPYSVKGLIPSQEYQAQGIITVFNRT